MSMLPETQVMVMPSSGEAGLSADILMPWPDESVTAVGKRFLKGIEPTTLQLADTISHCTETNIAPSIWLMDIEPDVNVYVQNLINLCFIQKGCLRY